jgi:hypothetical protein
VAAIRRQSLRVLGRLTVTCGRSVSGIKVAKSSSKQLETEGMGSDMTPRTGWPVFLLIAGLGACATVVPHQNAEGPAAAIRSAEEVGAARVPEAALRLQLAKEQLERARTMTSEEEQPRAARMLMRSQADAELALALARSSVAHAEAEKAKEKTKNMEGTAKWVR